MEPFPRPERTEAAEYYFTYIDQVPAGDIRAVLTAQASDVMPLLTGISETQADHKYGPDKWTIRQVLGHVNDTERLFTFRALWFARGFDSPLPSFDQNVAMASSGVESRMWANLLEEFTSVRAASLAFYNALPEEAWSRRGIASDNPFTVRALAYITAGHVIHHVRILRERYLNG